jgi:glutaredoxin
VKGFLSRVGVAYTARNVDEDDLAYDELLALGLRTVPVTVVGERAVKGYDEQALLEALRAAGERLPGP